MDLVFCNAVVRSHMVIGGSSSLRFSMSSIDRPCASFLLCIAAPSLQRSNGCYTITVLLYVTTEYSWNTSMLLNLAILTHDRRQNTGIIINRLTAQCNTVSVQYWSRHVNENCSKLYARSSADAVVNPRDATSAGIIQDHWKWRHWTDHIWLPIHV